MLTLKLLSLVLHVSLVAPGADPGDGMPDPSPRVQVTAGWRGLIGPSLEVDFALAPWLSVELDGTLGIFGIAQRPGFRGELGLRVRPLGEGADGFWVGGFLVIADYEVLGISHVHQFPSGGGAVGWSHSLGRFSFGFQVALSAGEVTNQVLSPSLRSTGSGGYEVSIFRQQTAWAPVFDSRVAIGFNL